MFTISFWLETLDRGVKSAAQATILAFGAAEAFNLFAADFASVGGLAFGAAVLSVLTSLLSAPFNQKGTASLIEAGN